MGIHSRLAPGRGVSAKEIRRESAPTEGDRSPGDWAGTSSVPESFGVGMD